jgi:hypothetical protein
MRITIVASGVLLAGCDLIFPLDLPAVEPPETPTVRGTVIVRNAELVDGSPSVSDLPGDDVDLRVRFANGERRNLAVEPGGLFEFVRPTNDYALEYELDGVFREIQDSAAELQIALLFAGRTDAEPLASGIAMAFPPAPAGSKGFVATIGQWTITALSPAGPGFDWGDATPVGRRDVGLFRGSRGDKMTYLQFADAALSAGQFAIGATAEIPTFEMTNGNVYNFSTEMVNPAAENGCVRIDAALEGAALQFEQLIASDPRYLTPDRTWNVATVPSVRQTGGVGAINLAAGVAGSVTSLDLTAFDAHYHNPFPTQELLVGIGISSSRSAAVGNSTAQLGAGFSFAIEGPARGACEDSSVLAMGDLPFPGDVQIDFMPLLADGQVVPSGRELIATWAVSTGAFDFFEVHLLELTDVGNTVKPEVVRSFRTRQPRLSMANDLLVPGHTYALLVASVIGHAGVAQGDYATISFPNGAAAMTSATFEAE